MFKLMGKKYSKICLERSKKTRTVKKDKTKVLKTNDSLMKLGSTCIAEGSLGEFCNTFDLH